MKNLFQNALLSTVDSLMLTLGRFRCQLYSLKLQENPPAVSSDDKDTLLTYSDVAEFLHVSVRTVRKYRTKGWIPFITVEKRLFCKKSDLTKALQLNPAISAGIASFGKSKPNPKNFYSKSVRIAPFINNWSIIRLSYLGWKGHIFIEQNKIKDENFVNSIVSSVIAYQHRVKPFCIPPDNIFYPVTAGNNQPSC